MEVFNPLRKVTNQLLSIALIVCCFLCSINTSAKQYRLDVLAELPTLSPANIIAFLPIPSQSTSEKKYLLANEQGDLSLLNGTKLTALLHLELLSQTTENPHVKLTALALHPSYSLADQPGYQTFYTAHIEPTKTNNNVARLTILDDPSILPFDAVITQWQLDTANTSKIDKQQRREVMRIAVPTATHKIQKIAFNPFSKAWHDDYGLLHIALSDNNQDKPTEDALYSGVILRVNPAKFGLRNYMVPNNNPFMKTSSINNEIFILGAQKISTFAWSKQHYSALLVQHTYDDNKLLAVAIKGTDWRKDYQEKQVFPLASAQENISNIFSYSGRGLKNLSGNVLYLSSNAKNWQLAAVDLTDSQNDDVQKASSNQEKLSINNKEISPKNAVKLIINHAGEPLLLDQTSKQLLTLTSFTKPVSGEDSVQDKDNLIEQPDSASSSAYGTLLLTLFLLILAVVFYRLRPRNNATKAQLRSQYARFTINDKKTTLSFYKRHQTEVSNQLEVADIVESEILLNNVSLNIINENIDNGYNLQLEEELRSNFLKEHRHKLIDDKVRQVHLYITDKNAKMHIVCLYLRKGNQRLTKEKYFEILESAIDWNWFIAKKLNSQSTTKRKIKAPVDKVSSTNTVTSKPVSPIVKKSAINVPVTDAKEAAKLTNDLHNIAIHDSELINDLDKLANLKLKGFLTDEEFSLAKAKILADITRNK